MTPRDAKGLARYIARTANDYGLGDWRIEFHADVEDDRHAGETSCVYGRKIAHLSLSSDFPSYSPEEQRQIVLHELTHIHFDQVTTLVINVLPDLIGKPAFDAFMVGYTQAMEHAVDAIADAIGDKYPLWEG